jgi:hypothetical protein
MIVNDELKRKWKKVVRAYFEVLSQYLPKRNEGNHQKTASG